jgi:glycosyltransferase involved in cell wall biosynthesis
MNPLVSVVIPFYNRVDWLCEAVESVLNQTYDNFEIIVVNDGSTEKMDDFLYKYGDKIIYKYKENGGAATARNLALEIATGDYIAFLDSDDMWLSNKTEKQISFMEKVNAMWSHTGFYNWNPDTDIIKKVDNRNDYGYVYEKIFISIYIATPSVILNRRVLDEHPELKFPVELRKGQDTAFFHALSKYYPLALVSEPLVRVREHGGNSKYQAIVRFNLRGSSYENIKNDPNVPKGVKRIKYIYYVYSKIFGETTNNLKEFIAKCFWTIPYVIERIYVRKIIRNLNQDKKYIT